MVLPTYSDTVYRHFVDLGESQRFEQTKTSDVIAKLGQIWFSTRVLTRLRQRISEKAALMMILLLLRRTLRSFLEMGVFLRMPLMSLELSHSSVTVP